MEKSNRIVLIVLLFTWVTMKVDSGFMKFKSKDKIQSPKETEPDYSWPAKQKYINCMKMISSSTTKNPSSIVVKDPQVILLVDSKVDDYESRCAIRATWSHYSQKQYSDIMRYVVMFQTGYQNEKSHIDVTRENQLFHDLIIHKKIPDIYSSLSKKMIASLEHIKKANYTSLKFIVKTDDDVYVTIKKYLKHLKAMSNINVDYEGLLHDDSEVITEETHKNYEPPHADLKKIFPPYCSGGGYFLKSTKLNCLISASKTHQNLINSDANIGYLLQFCNATMRNDQDYGYYSITNNDLYEGLELILEKIPFYFVHGLRKYDQIFFDLLYHNQKNFDD